MTGRIIYKEIDGLKFTYNFDITEGKYANMDDKFMAGIMRDYYFHSDWEPETTKLVKRDLKEGMVAVDVGASVGYFTLLFARQVGSKGKVYSIEPIKAQIPYLEENIRVNGFSDRCKVYNVGASDVNDMIVVNPSHKSEVQGLILDDILAILPRVDMIKIDVDGTENQVLKGLRKTFERNKEMKMIIEYYPKYLEMAGNSPQEFLDLVDEFFTKERVMGEFTDEYYNFYCTRK